MLNRLNYCTGISVALLLCVGIVLAPGCRCNEPGIPLDQPIVIGKPRVAEIRIVNRRDETITVLPASEGPGAVSIEPGDSWTVQTTVDRVTMPREWERHDELDLLFIEDDGQGAILRTLGPVEYFKAEGIDAYILLIDVGQAEEPWRIQIMVKASEMSRDVTFRDDLEIRNDDMVQLRIP